MRFAWCVSTVGTLIKSLAAISFVVIPPVIIFKISRSRGVSRASVLPLPLPGRAEVPAEQK